MAIAYVPHPVSTAEKQALRLQGFQIVDIKFMPETIGDGDKAFPKKKARKQAPKVDADTEGDKPLI